MLSHIDLLIIGTVRSKRVQTYLFVDISKIIPATFLQVYSKHIEALELSYQLLDCVFTLCHTGWECTLACANSFFGIIVKAK